MLEYISAYFQFSIKKNTREFIFLIIFRYVLREHVHPDGLRSQLSIPSVLRSDSGLFSCEASNDYGREEKSIQLIVQGKVILNNIVSWKN